MTDAKKHMRQDWDERARRNAFLYIASWRSDWDETSFFDSGEKDYLRLVEPVLQRLQFEPASHSVAELGCGAGRMTRSFAKRFRSVVAVDISAEMQARAKGYLNSLNNIHWVLSDGEKLSSIEAGSVNFVFSYLVLQHMPKKEFVLRSIEEMMRILVHGGIFLFQFNGSDLKNMNWRGRLISAALDRMSTIGLKRSAQNIARFAGIDPGMLGTTWRGVAISSREIREAVCAGGGDSVEFIDPGTPMAWCYGSKRTTTRV
jgi:SAM-dependent methyltransferase